MTEKEKALLIVNSLQKAGFVAGFVGGFCRDNLMGKEPHDIDIVTTAKPDQIKRSIPEAHFTEVGESFGIVVAVIQGETFEIATTRADIFDGLTDGRHPSDVTLGCTIEADSGRRDFTMNSIFLNPITNQFIDPFNGKQDIENKIIRFVGNPEDRINEDHLRILRAFRFKAKLGFDFSDDTFEALKKDCKDTNILTGVSVERITAEMNKILLAPHVAITLSLMARLGLLQQIIPEIITIIECDHDTPWHTEEFEDWGATVWSHTLSVVENAAKHKKELKDENRQLALMWAALLHDIGKPNCKTWKE
jgi:tRNA nucleotidyltransferase/poly(A) polymerase